MLGMSVVPRHFFHFAGSRIRRRAEEQLALLTHGELD